MSRRLIKKKESYRNWIREVSNRFRHSQIKATVKVNKEMLRFYWSVGKDISVMHLDAEKCGSFHSRRQIVSSLLTICGLLKNVNRLLTI